LLSWLATAIDFFNNLIKHENRWGPLTARCEFANFPFFVLMSCFRVLFCLLCSNGYLSPQTGLEIPTLPSYTKNEKQLPWVKGEVGIFSNFYRAYSAAHKFMHSLRHSHGIVIST
jgi:hypothetical protein